MLSKRYFLFTHPDDQMRFANALNHIRERSARTEIRPDGSHIVWTEGWLPERLAAVRYLLDNGRGPRTLTDACVDDVEPVAVMVGAAHPRFVGYDVGEPMLQMNGASTQEEPDAVEVKEVGRQPVEVFQEVRIYTDTAKALEILAKALGVEPADIVEDLVNERLREQFSKL